MRILIILHGAPPQEGLPSSGGAQRAASHARALIAAGHEVHLVTREQDRRPGGPPTFAHGPALREHALAVRPDLILCVQPEEAPEVEGLGVPLIVDLYAPRLIEAQFQDCAGIEAVRTIRAIQAGDLHLFSNVRQRDFYLGLLALSGVDVRASAGLVIPLVAPDGPPRTAPDSPCFVLGGTFWPWADPSEGLRRALAQLERRGTGRIVVYGGRPTLGDSRVLALSDLHGERLEFADVLPYDQLLSAYAGATAAIDQMAPNPERSIALSFRQLDYLGCGLPIIAGNDQPLSSLLRESGAGLVGLPIESAIDQLIEESAGDAAPWRARCDAARALAREHFSLERCEAPLLEWIKRPVLREKRPTPLGELAQALEALGEARAAQAAMSERVGRAEQETLLKRQEVESLSSQIRTLLGSVDQLSGAIAEVAGFKREAITVLGGDIVRGRKECAHLERELSIARADNAKKSAEIAAMEGERLRLENDLVHARQELEQLRKRGWLGR